MGVKNLSERTVLSRPNTASLPLSYFAGFAAHAAENAELAGQPKAGHFSRLPL
jgi:hypothetical protein